MRRRRGENEPLLDTIRSSSAGTWARVENDDNDNSLVDNREDPPQPQAPTVISLFWSILSDFIQHLRNMFQTMPQIAAQTSPLTNSKQANDLKALACATFDSKNPDDLECIKTLWKVCFPNESLPSNFVSDAWKKIGFQSDDPIRDIRGTGVFGVNNLLFFAEKYPLKFRRLIGLDPRHADSEKYPFVVGAFNITMMIFELLGWGWKTAGKSTAKNPGTHSKLCAFLYDNTLALRDSVFVFNELFCVAVQLLDDSWTEMKATYMDFPKVIVETQDRFEKVLTSFNRTADISTWNSEH